jgi:hypothetical protein
VQAAGRSLSPQRSKAPEKPKGTESRSTAAAGPAPAAPAGPSPVPGVAALEQRLAQLEEQNRQKDAQVRWLAGWLVKRVSKVALSVGSSPACSRVPAYPYGAPLASRLF